MYNKLSFMRARARSQFVLGWSGVVTPLGYRSVTELPLQSFFEAVANRESPMV